MSTYTPIATTTLTTDTTSITFSSIPQFYADLVFVVQAQSTASGSSTNGMRCRINNDTGNNYSYTTLNGNGSSASTGRETSVDYFIPGEIPQTSATARNLCVFTIINYANATTNKAILSRGNTADQTNTSIGLYRSTSAVTSVSISREFGVAGQALKSGSTVSVYGIQTGGGYALGGNIVTTDGTYWYHAFTTSGAFIPTQDLTADVLVVAGGGGGSHSGGGAGGFRGFTSQLLTKNSPYICTVGAGGIGSTNVTTPISGTRGGNSAFFGTGITTISATGGGGGSGIGDNGQSGGSGSGAGGASGSGPNRTGGSGNFGSYSPVEGFAGGNTSQSYNSNQPSGGGGGATAVGGTPTTSSVSGNGGAGSSAYSSWGSATLTGQNVSGTYWFAGGGGGGHGASGTSGTGGNGGGGNGVAGSSAPIAGLFATGGGGGGGNFTNATGGAGGSGIVIVRYAV